MTDSMLMQKDPVTFEVVRGGLYAICEEMKSVMMRASFSPLLSLSADLSCAILDQKGDVVAQGSDIPVHLGAMPFSAKGIIEAFPLETWRPGDAVLNNDPYSGGSHLPDMTLLFPSSMMTVSSDSQQPCPLARCGRFGGGVLFGHRRDRQGRHPGAAG